MSSAVRWRAMLPAARFLVLGYFAQATSAAILALLLTAFYHGMERR